MSLAVKLAPALVLSALLMSPAAAAPVGPNTMALPDDSLVVQVRSHGKGHGGKAHRGGKAHHGKAHHGKAHHGKRHGHPGVRHHGHRGHVHHHRHHGGRWVAGHRYYAAPPGWYRYSARPWNWQTRGCIVVGTFWFCP